MTESTLIMGLNDDGLGEKIRKTREGKPKSRNGCRTCKLRRVKCDETKPHCMRCTRFGQRCDGYLSKTPSKSSLQSTPVRMLAPRAINSPSHLPPSSREHFSSESPDPSFSPTKSPISDSPDQMEAFHAFCAQLSQHLSTIDSKEWSRLVWGLYEDSPTIRKSITILGSLATATSTPIHEQPSIMGTLRHQFAYEETQRPSSLFLQSGFGGADAGTTDFQSVMSCLVFSCAEEFKGLRDLPLQKLFMGLRQLKDMLINVYGSGDWQRTPKEEDMNPTDLEIMKAFKDFEMQLMAAVNQKESYDGSPEAVARADIMINSMPAAFETVDEARRSLDAVIRKSMHWLRRSLREPNVHDKRNAADSRVLHSRNIGTTSESDHMRLGILRDYERWDEAYRPLLKFARSKGSSEENFLRASLLRLKWLSGHLTVSTNNHTSVSSTSIVNTPQQQQLKIDLDEMISIASLLLKSQMPAPFPKHHDDGHNINMEDATERAAATKAPPKLKLDMDVLAPIVAVAWTYRHRALRKQAVDLLMNYGQELGWDAIVFVKTMAWLTQVEEAGLLVALGNDGRAAVEFIPEDLLVRGVEIRVERQTRLALVRCLELVKGGRRHGEEIELKFEIFW